MELRIKICLFYKPYNQKFIILTLIFVNVVVNSLLFIVAPHVCGSFALGPCFVVQG